MIQPTSIVAAMDPYPLPSMGAAPPRLALAMNESAHPPSPAVAPAVQKAMTTAALYPDSGCAALRAAIAEVHGLDAAAVHCGVGSMDLISCLVAAFAGPGDTVVSTQFAYAYFRTATARTGAAYAAAPESGFTVDVDAVLDAVTDSTTVVCITNPGNPTGTRIANAEIRRLRDALPARVLLIVDEAYGEYADGVDAPLFDLAARGDTAVLRTFSKAYALAGLRVGWGVMAETIAAEVRKVQDPGNLSAPALAAAEAAMRDQDHRRAVVVATATVRDAFAGRLTRAGLACPTSATNFVLIPFADAETAARVDAALREAGIVLRPMGLYGLDHCLRATVGTSAQMDEVAERILEAL
jgi:histidinol-phosphate aminotransferase